MHLLITKWEGDSILQILYYSWWIFILAIVHATEVFAIDLLPGEIRAPKPGVSFIMLSYQISERGDLYLHGKKQPGTPEIYAPQFQVRLGHFFEIANHPSAFLVFIPFGYVHPAGSISAMEGDSGIGDTMFVLAFWPYANHETQTYFGVGAYFFCPTGSYSYNRSFNMGQNRYRAALQTGYQAQLAGPLAWSVAVDAISFGDDDEFGPKRANREQKVLYTGQTGLLYDINRKYSVGATYYYTAGGKTSVNGVNQDDTTQLTRYQLTGNANFSFGRFTLQYGQDIKTRNGFIEDSRWILHYTKIF